MKNTPTPPSTACRRRVTSSSSPDKNDKINNRIHSSCIDITNEITDDDENIDGYVNVINDFTDGDDGRDDNRRKKHDDGGDDHNYLLEKDIPMVMTNADYSEISSLLDDKNNINSNNNDEPDATVVSDGIINTDEMNSIDDDDDDDDKANHHPSCQNNAPRISDDDSPTIASPSMAPAPTSTTITPPPSRSPLHPFHLPLNPHPFTPPIGGHIDPAQFSIALTNLAFSMHRTEMTRAALFGRADAMPWPPPCAATRCDALLNGDTTCLTFGLEHSRYRLRQFLEKGKVPLETEETL